MIKMNLRTKKILASKVLHCSPKKVKFNLENLEEIKEAITKEDMRSLFHNGAIIKINNRGVSRVRARKRIEQRRKGRRKGQGSRKGTRSARLRSKTEWMNKVRAQRNLLRGFREKAAISKKDYQLIYMKIKGGFFRSRRHINLYIKEHGMLK